MEISHLGIILWVPVTLLVAVLLPAAHANAYWHHGIVSFPYKPMVIPAVQPPYNAIVLPPSHIHMTGSYFKPHQNMLPFSPPLFRGPMMTNTWTRPPISYVNPTNTFYRNHWHVPRIVPNHVRHRTYNVNNAQFKMQTKEQKVSKPTFKAFTKAPVYKTVSSVPKRKKTRISVLSGPLVDVRPSPVHNSMKHHMRKKAMFKSIAKAKPFRHILSGTALGLNKV